MEKLDKKRYLKRVIIVCWLALIICSCIKLFGGNLFEIVCENENFIKVCNYADNHWWADYLISCAYCLVSNYFFILAICGKWKFTRNQFIVFAVTTFCVCFIKFFGIYISLIADVWQVIIMPCIFTIKEPKRHWFVLLGNIMAFGFQTISMLMRNISFGIVTNNGTLVSMIYSIDVVLMFVLYYLYSNFKRERRVKNG